jgi:exosortase E/protease (VPEID-CTERM system)
MLAPYLPLLWRLALAGAVVVAELVFRITLLPDDPLQMVPSGPLLRTLYRFLVAWAAVVIILAVSSGEAGSRESARGFAGTALHGGWLAAHFALAVPMVWPDLLEWMLGGTVLAGAHRFLPHAIAPIAVFALLRGLAPLEAWRALFRSTGRLPLLALPIAAAAVTLIPVVQFLWEPATAVTFVLVKAELLPFFPDLEAFPAEKILATQHLEVTIDQACSGLEGVGLMLAFCTGWLWLMRRDFRFPRALLILPAAIVTAFFLNSVRISLLFVIADMGFVEVAMAGFHSQAGWIFFLAVAFLVAVVSRQTAWLQRADRQPSPVAGIEKSPDQPVAAFLLPLLAILATGMLVNAISAGFETLYVLRLVACAMVLVIYRHAYLALDWRFGWRGIAGGVLVFGVWIAAGHWLVEPAQMPAPLEEMSPAMRGLWLATRIAATAVTVPIAEELAFRGFLMRRFARADFTAIRLRDVTPVAVLLSSVLFGATHGVFWAPGILAGLVYAALARITGRIGEAVAAHATTNALLAVAVLCFDQWQLW